MAKNIRDQIYQPGFQNWNLGLFKKFAITERTGIQFRAEAFNFVNHPNWVNQNGDFNVQPFGTVQRFQDNRGRQ